MHSSMNAQIDLAHIAEVTEIQFASNDPVAVAAKCLAELSKLPAWKRPLNSQPVMPLPIHLHQVQSHAGTTLTCAIIFRKEDSIGNNGRALELPP